MLRKISSFIVKKRVFVLILFAILTVCSVFTVGKTVINYDFTHYLGKNTVTRSSLAINTREFGSTDLMTVMLKNADENVPETLMREFSDMDGIMRASYDAAADSKEMNAIRYDRINLFLETDDAVAFVDVVRDFLKARSSGFEDYSLNGSAPQTLVVQENIAREVPIAMIIAVIVVVGVLFLTSHSYIEPAIFGISLIVSILINMGTNFIFSSISFITFAVCAILQLALSMDYSIMLLHTFFEIRDGGTDDETALVLALERAFMPICSSSLTTVAGLVSLMFMSFTIGFDIGIVLSKGILISMLTVFTLVPALILLFRKPLRSTMHKTVPLGGKLLGKIAFAGRKVIPFVLIAVIIVSAVLQGRIEYTFTDVSTNMESSEVARVFGMTNQLILLFPARQEDADFDHQREFIAELQKIEYQGHPAVSDVSSMVTTAEAAIKYYNVNDIGQMLSIPPLAAAMYMGAMGFPTSVRGDVLIDKAAGIMTDNAQVQELKSTMDFAKRMFMSENYARMILLLDVPTYGNEAFAVIDEIRGLLDRFYPGEETGIAGNLMVSYDISNAFTSDMFNVNVITVIAILIVIFLSFRRLAAPVILVCVIQGAVWVNMGISVLTDSPIFFMCYLICLAIQMGATIDYGILLTTNYREKRLTLDRKDAITEAIKLSMPTIFTSGLILTVAGFAIGYVCSVYYIYSIGRLLARGTICSLVMILFLLPPLLIDLDKFVVYKNK